MRRRELLAGGQNIPLEKQCCHTIHSGTVGGAMFGVGRQRPKLENRFTRVAFGLRWVCGRASSATIWCRSTGVAGDGVREREGKGRRGRKRLKLRHNS